MISVVNHHGHLIKQFKTVTGARRYIDSRVRLAVRRGWKTPEIYIKRPATRKDS